MGKFEELRNDVVDAFEESTGEPPNDYDMAEINMLVHEEVDE
jgi:hypothetical protein